MSQLRALNSSVAKWITEHVDSNPYCILTPIFTDYEKHLEEIELKYGEEAEKEDGGKEKTSAVTSSISPFKPFSPAKKDEKGNTVKPILRDQLKELKKNVVY